MASEPNLSSCAQCGAAAPSGAGAKALPVCAGCRRVAYCGRDCQRAAWRAGHKQECGGRATAATAGALGDVAAQEEAVRGWRGCKDLAALRAGAEAGDAAAQFALGLAHRDGLLGLRPDKAAMLALFRRASDAGLARAQYDYGFVLAQGIGENGLGSGRGADPPEGLRLMRLAAEQGMREAVHNVAAFLREGIGAPVDLPGALRHELRAAEMGDPEAQSELARAYSQGIGTRPDYNEAVRWGTKAAAAGSTHAMLSLAAVLMGMPGSNVPVDAAAACRWLYRAATEPGGAHLPFACREAAILNLRNLARLGVFEAVVELRRLQQ